MEVHRLHTERDSIVTHLYPSGDSGDCVNRTLGKSNSILHAINFLNRSPAYGRAINSADKRGIGVLAGAQKGEGQERGQEFEI